MSASLELLQARIEHLTEIRKLQELTLSGRVYLVGGAIRELALGQVPRDYDFALEDPLDTARLEELLQAKGFLLGKKPIQTYRIVAADTVFDLTFLSNGIDQDLARRDFTMNAIAYELGSRKIFDPFQG